MRSDPSICGIPEPLLGFGHLCEDFVITEDTTEGSDGRCPCGDSVWKQSPPDRRPDAVGADKKVKIVLDAVDRFDLDALASVLERLDSRSHNQIDAVAASTFGKTRMEVISPYDPTVVVSVVSALLLAHHASAAPHCTRFKPNLPFLFP